MNIRTAHLDDTPALARVMVDTFLAAHREQIPEGQWQQRKTEWSYDVSAKGWRRTLAEIAASTDPETCIHVAEDEFTGEIVGLAVGCLSELEFLPNAGEISALYILPQHQRRGLGRRLIRAAATQLAELGCTALLIGALDANVSGRAFYEAVGGQIVGERHSEDYGFPQREVIYGWPSIGVWLAPMI
jgi:ribosomal protein S18 acetylase RimI-like enzyme